MNSQCRSAFSCTNKIFFNGQASSKIATGGGNKCTNDQIVNQKIFMHVYCSTLHHLLHAGQPDTHSQLIHWYPTNQKLSTIHPANTVSPTPALPPAAATSVAGQQQPQHCTSPSTRPAPSHQLPSVPPLNPLPPSHPTAYRLQSVSHQAHHPCCCHLCLALCMGVPKHARSTLHLQQEQGSIRAIST